ERFLASFMKRLETHEKGKGPEGLEAPRAEDNAGTPAAPTALAEEGARSLDPVPPAELGSETGAAASPEADLVPAPPADSEELPPAEAVLRLPWPWNTMNPAEVPEEVWQRARAAHRKEGASTPGCDA